MIMDDHDDAGNCVDDDVDTDDDLYDVDHDDFSISLFAKSYGNVPLLPLDLTFVAPRSKVVPSGFVSNHFWFALCRPQFESDYRPIW